MNPKTILEHFQNYYLMTFRGVLAMGKRPFYLNDTIDQMSYAGAGSLSIVILVMLFVGMALSLQISAEFAILGLQMYTGRVVGISIISEIGPVTIALIYAGRAGSGMASELGSMVLRNQLDSLRAFGVDPIKKLIGPRILSSLIMLPALTIIGNFVSIVGGAYIAVVVNNQSASVYWNQLDLILLNRYLLPGTLKPFVFGFIIASVSCYAGLSTKGGAVGLKSSTTRAFVTSTILIIIMDFVVTKIILSALGYSI
ncbi:MAG: MlaE family ABC transporter permease [Chitinispirillaceae bacterium]